MATQKNHISSCSLSLHKLKGQASPIVFLYILLVNSPIDTELYKEVDVSNSLPTTEPWPPWLFFYLVALALVLLCEVYLALVLLCEVY